MMKINLLGGAAPAAGLEAKGPAARTTKLMAFLGALVVCFGVVGVIYRIWSGQISALEKRRQQEKVRQAELAVVKAKNDEYQGRLKDLERRVSTIKALEASRTGPVELMAALGNVVNLTRDVYLYTVTPAGPRFELKGQSGTVDSMASFMADLKRSGVFDDVQLVQFYEDDLKDRLTYKFTVTCQFKGSMGAGAAPGGTGARAAARAGASAEGTSVPPTGPAPGRRTL